MLKTLTAKDVSYNAIFVSAFKALVIFELLLESPKTLDEIQAYLKTIPHIKANLTKDTLRIYLKTFQKAGCEIIKELTQKKHREYTYFIPTNPFYPNMDKKQIKRFFEIYDILLYNLKFPEIIELEAFTRYLIKNLRNKNFNTTYNNHSLLKDFDLNLLKELHKCCLANNVITVLYNSPRSGPKEISILSKKIKLQNYKLYIEGFGFEHKENAIFLIDRIIKIINIEPKTSVEIPKSTNIDIICEFYDSSIKLHENEELIDTTQQKRIIKHTTNNLLLSNQRFLQLAENCKIIEPLSYKKDFINLLKSSNKGYIDER